MDDFKEMFELFKSMYEGIYNKELKYDDFMEIYPKLKMINHHHFFNGNEIIELIEELLKIRKNNILDRVTEESIELVKAIYCFQPHASELHLQVLDKMEILKHLILPYNMNKCEEEFDVFVYFHMMKFEYLFSVLGDFLATDGNKYLETVRKYNVDLYNSVLYTSKYSKKIMRKTIKKDIICTSIIRLFSVFYFKQDEYNNDYSLMDSITNNIIDNEEYFVDYCDKEGITLLCRSPEECNNTYRGLIKLLDESYLEKKKRMG